MTDTASPRRRFSLRCLIVGIVLVAVTHPTIIPWLLWLQYHHSPLAHNAPFTISMFTLAAIGHLPLLYGAVAEGCRDREPVGVTPSPPRRRSSSRRPRYSAKTLARLKGPTPWYAKLLDKSLWLLLWAPGFIITALICAGFGAVYSDGVSAVGGLWVIRLAKLLGVLGVICGITALLGGIALLVVTPSVNMAKEDPGFAEHPDD